MSMNFEDQYFDQLRAIELAIYNYYTENPDLVDFRVDQALSALERLYTAQDRGKKEPRLRLKKDEQQIFDAVKQALDVFLGRDPEIEVEPGKQITLDEAVRCIKRIRRSVNLMRDRGRQGYLEFISDFFL